MSEFEVIHGIRLFTADDMVVKHYRDRNNSFEPESMSLWDAYIEGKGRGVVIDGGCYSGIYSLRALKKNPLAWVLGFDINRWAVERAWANIKFNNELLENSNSRAPMIINSALNHTGKLEKVKIFGRFRGSSAFRVVDSGIITETVPSVTLNEALIWYGPGNQPLLAIKLDLEGGELKALMGGLDVIRENKPLIIAEFLDNDNFQKLWMFKERMGYSKGQVLDGRNFAMFD